VSIRKSKYIFTFYLIASFIGTLVLSTLISSFIETGYLPDGLSQNSWRFQLQSDSDAITRNELISLLIEKETPFLLYAGEGLFGREFYIHEKEFPIQFHKTSDTRQGKVAFLNTSLVPNVYSQDGNYIFFYQSNEFIVSGIFERGQRREHRDSQFLVSMDLSQPVPGTYIIDGLEEQDVIRFFNKLIELHPELIIRYTPMQLSLSQRFNIFLQVQGPIILSLSLVLIYIICGTITHSFSWIASRKDEVFIRTLVGATRRDIKKWILFEYSFVLLLSYLFGFFVAFIVMQLGTFNGLFNQFTIYGAAVAFSMYLLLGGTTIALVNVTFLKNIS